MEERKHQRRWGSAGVRYVENGCMTDVDGRIERLHRGQRDAVQSVLAMAEGRAFIGADRHAVVVIVVMIMAIAVTVGAGGNETEGVQAEKPIRRNGQVEASKLEAEQS